jgi:catechol 2,3-dioxygenase-like lactoylglutathione lyase family enzyme
MIDHTGIIVSNFERSKKFYTSSLAPLGYQLLRDLVLLMQVLGSAEIQIFGLVKEMSTHLELILLSVQKLVRLFRHSTRRR